MSFERIGELSERDPLRLDTGCQAGMLAVVVVKACIRPVVMLGTSLYSKQLINTSHPSPCVIVTQRRHTSCTNYTAAVYTRGKSHMMLCNLPLFVRLNSQRVTYNYILRVCGV